MVNAATGSMPIAASTLTPASGPTLARPSASRMATTGMIAMLVSSLAFSSSGPVLKPLLEAGWSVGAVLLLRMTGAALMLSPALVIALRRHGRALVRQWPLFLGFGLTGVAGCQFFYFQAMQRMPVAVALLIQYTAPVLLVVWAWARNRQRPAARVLAGSVVSLAGLVLVVDITGARVDALGMVFALCAAVCVAVYFVISGRAGGELPPLALASGGLIVGAAVMGLLVLTGILPFETAPVNIALAGLDVPWWAAIAWVALVATSSGYALGVVGVRRLGARVASFAGLSEVLFAVLFAWVLLGEAPSLVQAAGGVLVIAGVVLVRADAERAAVTGAIPVVSSQRRARRRSMRPAGRRSAR